MKLLDLFCGAGGAAMGYHRAGFEVTGYDIKPQRHYPFPFVQGDVERLMRMDALDLTGFDAVHASPPCQLFSTATGAAARGSHLDLLTATREWLQEQQRRGWRGLWVIENVPGAPLRQPLQLCGSEFGLHCTDADGQRWHLRRHRLFESNAALMGAGGCYCRLYRNEIMAVAGHGPHARDSLNTHGRLATGAQASALLGIKWMARRELSQAIPPAYTEHIGYQLAAALQERSRA